MALEFRDSRYGETTKTLSDLIVLVLAKEPGLRIGELCTMLKSLFSVSLTFQAVRKSLNVLVDRKVLLLINKTYSLNKDYILEQKRLSDQMLKNYFTAEKKNNKEESILEGETYQEFVFENLLQLDKFWGELVLDWSYNLKTGDDSDFFFHGPHCWYVLGHMGVEFDFLSILFANGVNSFYLVDGNSKLDKWTKSFYLENNVNYVLNKTKTPTSSAMGVFGNTIIEFTYPKKLYSEIEDFYSSSNDISKLNMSTLISLLKQKNKLKLTVLTNPVLVNKVKSELKTHF